MDLHRTTVVIPTFIGRTLQRLLRPARAGAMLLAGAAGDLTRTRSELLAENALLRQQVIVLRRSNLRPRLHRDDRLLFLVLARLGRGWRDTLHVVSPDTLLRWHRDLFKLFWRRKSRPRRQPRRLAPAFITLIRTMASDNVLWGAERIRGELLKLGIEISKRTIQKYMREVRPPSKRGQTWGTFIRNHSDDVWAFLFVVHGTREVVHFNVTRHPTDAWAAQQLREATPYGDGPSYLIRDNDGKFGKKFASVADGTGVDVVKIPPRAPNLNPICERFLGSVRRECLDHIVILSERQLHRVLKEYVETYFNRARPHQGLCQRIPIYAKSRSSSETGRTVAAIPRLGGLHHEYRWAA